VIELGPALVRFTGRAEGDLGHAGAYVSEVLPDVAARRAAVLDRPWSWLRQVHGDRVVRVEGAGAAAGETADAAVTRSRDAALAVLVADCAPVALAAPEGVVAVVHAGWRGLVAGVIERAVAAVRDLGATEVLAALGPCIHAECYEFGAGDLDAVAARLGDGVRGTTAAGRPALDVPAAVRAALAAAGAALVYEDARCTSCDAAAFFSYRARAEPQRQAVVAWLP
jgi:purine-nucleoside/S-methyl-5'-thioadenosine phosphorylase / adenosine deaminase